MSTEKVVYILVLSGPLKNHKFIVKSDSPILIGRDADATIRITYDDYCSRKHALISWQDNSCSVEDLNSKNGTFLNDVRVHGKNKLENKDVIGLGSTQLIVLINDYQDKQKSDNGSILTLDNIKKGHCIGNRYKVHRILEGGMGIIYICYDDLEKNPVVLKTYKKTHVYSKENEEIFKREALAWVRLEKHPNIVRAYTVERFEGILFIVLEFIAPDEDGKNTLTHFLGELTFEQILLFSIQICCGMQYAYSKGVDAHRDIKPDNIMITTDRVAKITDFGLVKVLQDIKYDSQEERNPRIFESKVGRTCGTLSYMAPEQFDGFADERSDVYSFGIVLYQMVANGKLPYVGKSLQEYERLHKSKSAPFLFSPLFNIIRKCLEKKPKKRYKNFNLLMEDLQKLYFKKTGREASLYNKEELDISELNQKGSALINLERHREAEICFDSALARNPDNGYAWFGKAYSLNGQGKHEEAIVCLNKGLGINGNDVAITCRNLCAKGLCLVELKRSEEAIMCFDEALEINPKYEPAWGSKAVVFFFILKEYEDALVCCDKIIEINSRKYNAWYIKSLSLFNLGRYQESVICFDKASEIRPHATYKMSEHRLLLYSKGLALVNLGRHGEAIIFFDKALEIDPLNASTWYAKGYSLTELKRYAEGLRCAEEILKLEPDNQDGQLLKNNILSRLKRNA